MATLLVRAWMAATVVGFATVGRQEAFAEVNAVAWGEAADGVRCRVVAIDPKSDDEASGLSRVVASFATGKEVTLGVELQNVSDWPTTLLGVHLSQRWGDASGRLAVEEVGPQLFAFDFTNARGQPISPTDRKYALDDVLDSASAHELAPGQSLIVALRPARFDFPMDTTLPAGEYRVRVHYHGTTEAARLKWAGRLPDSAQSRAWTGSVVSNEVSFRVEAGRRRAAPEELAWGEPKEGLRTAIELRRRDDDADGDEAFKVGSSLDVALLVQNVAAKPVSLQTEWRTGDVLTATNSTKTIEGQWGGAMAVTGLPRVVEWTLQPGEIAEISRMRANLVANERAITMSQKERAWDEHLLVVEPGRYSMQYTIGRFGGMQTGSPLKQLRGGLVTGETPLVVR